MSPRPVWPESARLAALGDYRLSTMPADGAFDDIVAFAAQLCGVPTALISLVERDRQWFKARIGFDRPETPRGQSFCAGAMLDEGLTVVTDAGADPRFADNPLVTGEPGIRFYAGAPLRSPEGAPLGTLCVIDTVPRPEGLTALQAHGLKLLADQVMARFELRRQGNRQTQREAHVQEALSVSRFVGSFDWAVEPDRVTADAGFARMFSLTPPTTAAGLPLAAFVAAIHPEDRGRVEHEIREALAAGDHYESEYRVVQADGSARWLMARAEVMRDPTGQVVRFAGLAIDISERRRMEDALRASEAKFRAIADAMPQMVWSTLPDGFHDYYNARWYAFTGVPEGSTDGEAWNGMFHPDDQARAWERWRHSLATGEPYEIEYRLRHRSGEYRWTLGLALPIRDAAGRIERWFGTCTDIHATKQAAALLEDAQLRLQLALTAAEIGVWEVEVATGRLTWDERVRRVTGYTEDRDPTYADDFLRVLHPGDRDAVDAALRQAMADGEDVDVEFRLVPLDGARSFWAVIKGRRIVRADGSVHLIGTALDIDAQKSLSDERAIVAQELSHRIKNIFAVISGIIGVAARGFPEARPFAQQLRERLAALGRAHDFVRPHSLDSRPHDGEVKLSGLLRELFAPYVDERGERIRFAGADPDIPARAVTPLALLFHELATNATKYGALSQAEGRVALTGTLDETRYQLDWKETGGPALAGAAVQEGFGTRLAKVSAEGQLRGRIERLWEPDGLRVRVTLPRESFSPLDPKVAVS